MENEGEWVDDSEDDEQYEESGDEQMEGEAPLEEVIQDEESDENEVPNIGILSVQDI